MSANSTTLTEDTATIEREFEALAELKVDSENWPLGCQTIQVPSRSERTATYAGVALHPMEPFVSQRIRYRLEVGELANPSCLVMARAGRESWLIGEAGVHDLEYPSSAGSLRLYIQAYGPSSVSVLVTVGEQRRC